MSTRGLIGSITLLDAVVLGGDGGGPAFSSPQLQEWPRDVEVIFGGALKENSLQITLASLLLQRAL